MKKNAKKAVNAVIIVIQLVIIVACIVFSVFTLLANNNEEDNAAILSQGYHIMPVLSDSMNGDQKDSFKSGDVIITKTPKDKTELQSLEVGQIITYFTFIQDIGEWGFVSHRITSKAYDTNNDQVGYFVQGDNLLATSEDLVRFANVQAYYTGKVEGLGTAVLWLATPMHFFGVIIVPLILLLIYNIIVFIRVIETKKRNEERQKQEQALEELKKEQEEKMEALKKQMMEELLNKKEKVLNIENESPTDEEDKK